MNWIDLTILLVIVFFAVEGQKRGLLIQVFDIFGFLISLVFSISFYPIAAKILVNNFDLPKIVANPVGFLLIWLIMETLFFTIFSPLIRKMLVNFETGAINRYLGFIPAIANALLLSAFVLLFTVSLPIKPEIKKDIFDAQIGSLLVAGASTLERPFNSIFGPISKQTLTFLTVSPEEKGSVNLEFTQEEYTLDQESERQMLDLVNKARTQLGIKALEWNEQRAEVARNHSKDMFNRGYFSHYSKEGKDVGNRLDESGINYTYAGENLALAPDVTRAHIGLMNSEGHRRNILDPAFSKIGIGVIDGGVYGKMFTQVFTN